jgi:hypothetical protein
VRSSPLEAGYDWDLSICQVEVSLTQILERSCFEAHASNPGRKTSCGKLDTGTVTVKRLWRAGRASPCSWICECRLTSMRGNSNRGHSLAYLIPGKRAGHVSDLTAAHGGRQVVHTAISTNPA